MTTEQDTARERITSYIVHQAKKEPNAIKKLVQKGHDQLLSQMDGLSEEQATFKGSEDDWSVRELLRHALQAKRGVAGTCQSLALGEAREGTAEAGAAQASSPCLPRRGRGSTLLMRTSWRSWRASPLTRTPTRDMSTRSSGR